MIKIDYLIERNEGDEVKQYFPDQIPNQLSNVVYIQGPNSSGKSTLLNLIALAFYGNKLHPDDIDPSLKNKIINMINLEHQRLTFDLSVDNPEMGITLISQKTNKNTQDISVKKIIDGKEIQLSSETFMREFKLIYDIPHNPLERLPQLLSEVKTTQKDIGQRIELFRQYLWNLIEDIKNSRDPVVLANLKKKYDALEIEQTNIDRDVKRFKELGIKVFGFGLCKAFISFSDDLGTENSRLNDLNNQINSTSREGRKRAADQSRTLKRIDKVYTDCQFKYEIVFGLLPQLVASGDQVHLKLWKQSVLHDEIYHPEVHKTLRTETNHFIFVLNEKLEQERMVRQKDLKAIELYKFLLTSFSGQNFGEINLPGINQTVETFLSLISKELQAHENLINELDRLEVCIKSLNEFSNSLEIAIDTIKELSDLETPAEDDLNLESMKREKTLIEKRIREIENQLLAYRNSLVKNNIDPLKAWQVYDKYIEDEELSRFFGLSIDAVINQGKEIYELAKNKAEQLFKVNTSLEKLRSEILIMENKSPHEYHDHLETINYIYQKVQRLEQRFKKQYSEYIERVIKGEDQGKGSDDEIKYSKLVGKFLAKKMHTLKHIDTLYEIQDINMSEQKIYTTSNKEIFFADLGTGQSQAAFLAAKLTMHDNKKIIALFDEVAMMDENSLKPVMDKIVNLYENKKLFMAIIVQKNDVVKVEGLI